MITILSVIALCMEAVLLVYFVAYTAKYKKPFSKKTLWYAVPVYILVYFLYTIGYIYNEGSTNVIMVLRMVAYALETFIFRINVDVVLPLAKANAWYYAAALIALLFAGATFVASAAFVFGHALKNKFAVKKSFRNGCDIVIGNSPSALRYARKNGAVVFTFQEKEKANELIGAGYRVVECDFSSKNCRIAKKLSSNNGQMRHAIVFADNNFTYTTVIKWFGSVFGGIANGYFALHIEASLEDMDIINRKFIDAKEWSDNICVTSFNRYKFLARKFITENSLSLDLPENFYTGIRTVKPEKKINVVILGFGKVNYELMKLMVMQYQFAELSADGSKFQNHPVDYYIFDSTEERLYTEMLMLLQNEKRCRLNDLPPCEEICRIRQGRALNVYSEKFSEEFAEIVGDPNSFNYVIVSIGNDFQNIALAEHLRDYFPYGNMRLFSRVKDATPFSIQSDGITYFGFEDDLFDRRVLVNEELNGLARDLNSKYTNNVSDAIRNFNLRPSVEKYSNLYHAASVSFKKGLLKLKYVKKDEVCDESKILDKNALRNLYVGYSDKSDYGKYFRTNVWSMLGFSEHSRWAALYLLKGFRQMAFDEIRIDRSGAKPKIITKDLNKRKHCCMTSFYGLDIYHKHLVSLWEQIGVPKTIDDVETYKYDYMVVDDAYDAMTANGYVLVRVDSQND